MGRKATGPAVPAYWMINVGGGGYANIYNNELTNWLNWFYPPTRPTPITSMESSLTVLAVEWWSSPTSITITFTATSLVFRRDSSSAPTAIRAAGLLAPSLITCWSATDPRPRKGRASTSTNPTAIPLDLTTFITTPWSDSGPVVSMRMET